MSYSTQWAEQNGIPKSAKTEAKEKELLQLFEQHKPYHGIVKLSDWDD